MDPTNVVNAVSGAKAVSTTSSSPPVNPSPPRQVDDEELETAANFLTDMGLFFDLHTEENDAPIARIAGASDSDHTQHSQNRLSKTSRILRGVVQRVQPLITKLDRTPSKDKPAIKQNVVHQLNQCMRGIDRRAGALSEDHALLLFETLTQLEEIGCEELLTFYDKLQPSVQQSPRILRVYLTVATNLLTQSNSPKQQDIDKLIAKLDKHKTQLPPGESAFLTGKLMTIGSEDGPAPLAAQPYFALAFKESKSLMHAIFLVSMASELRDTATLERYLPLLPVLVERDGGYIALDQELRTELLAIEASLAGGPHACNLRDSPFTTDVEMKACLRGSYNYRGMTGQSLSGNFRFGGLVPDQVINNADRRVFHALVSTPLSRIIDVDKLTADERQEVATGKSLKDLPIAEASRWADIITRQRFRNDELNLEELQSAGHKEFEQLFAVALQQFSIGESADSRRQAFSRTNVSAALLLGIGDCRQHAQVKQLIWDTLQREQIDTLTNQYLDGTITQEELKEQSEKLLALDLRTFDVEIHSNIQIRGMYDEITDKEGRRLLSDTETVPEEHTMNILVNRKTGVLTKADAFYHHRYPFAEGQLPAADVFVTDWDMESYYGEMGSYSAEVTDRKAHLKPSHGKFRIAAGEQTVWNAETGKEVSIPVYIQPTAYAGKRDVSDPLGETIYCLGTPLSGVTAEAIVESTNAAQRTAVYRSVVADQ